MVRDVFKKAHLSVIAAGKLTVATSHFDLLPLRLHAMALGVQCGAENFKFMNGSFGVRFAAAEAKTVLNHALNVFYV